MEVQPIQPALVEKDDQLELGIKKKEGKKTERRPNFLAEEELALATGIKKRVDIIYGQFKGSTISKITKNQAWNQILNEVNAVGNLNRTLDEIQTKNKNMKASTKKIESSNRREMRKTGGGEADIEELNESQRIIIETIPEECIGGILGGIDINEVASNNLDKTQQRLLKSIPVTPTTSSHISTPKDVTTSEQSLAIYIGPNQTTSSTLNTDEVVSPDGSEIPLTTPRSLPFKRRHRSLPSVPPTENLLRQQVDLFGQQLDVMKNIRDLMEERNAIEKEKLELKKKKYN